MAARRRNELEQRGDGGRLQPAASAGASAAHAAHRAPFCQGAAREAAPAALGAGGGAPAARLWVVVLPTARPPPAALAPASEQPQHAPLAPLDVREVEARLY